MFKDKLLVSIFEKIISSYSTEKGKGLPIGNLTSQYFANRYLGTLDHIIKHNFQIKHYVRYMDDFVVWHSNKQTLISAGKKIEAFIKDELNLELKFKILNKTENGLSFLSYRIFPTKIVLTQKAKKRYITKIKESNYKLANQFGLNNNM